MRNLALFLIYPAVLLYGLWLWRFLTQLGRRVERLQMHCQRCRQEISAALAGRLEHPPDIPPHGEGPYPHNQARPPQAPSPSPCMEPD